jgi:hypothetical protein
MANERFLEIGLGVLVLEAEKLEDQRIPQLFIGG